MATLRDIQNKGVEITEKYRSVLLDLNTAIVAMDYAEIGRIAKVLLKCSKNTSDAVDTIRNLANTPPDIDQQKVLDKIYEICDGIIPEINEEFKKSEDKVEIMKNSETKAKKISSEVSQSSSTMFTTSTVATPSGAGTIIPSPAGMAQYASQVATAEASRVQRVTEMAQFVRDNDVINTVQGAMNAPTSIVTIASTINPATFNPPISPNLNDDVFNF